MLVKILSNDMYGLSKPYFIKQLKEGNMDNDLRPGCLQEWVEQVANIPVSEDKRTPEVCIIELGGTIGDIEGMPFVEAFRQFQFKARQFLLAESP